MNVALIENLKQPTPSGPTFLPTNLPGLVRWGKPDTMGLADGTLVTSYPDLSGNGFNFVASGTSPTYKANVVNGLGAILYDGSTTWMSCDTLGHVFTGVNVPFTWFGVVKHTQVPIAINLANPGHQCYWILAQLVASGQTHDLFVRTESYSRWSDRRNDAATLELSFGMGDFLDLAWRRLIFTFDGTLSTMYADGIIASAFNQNAGQLTLDILTYGAHRRPANGIDSFLWAYMAEEGWYNNALSAGNVALLDAYLAKRYALSGVVPWDPWQLLT
jgi:hypothetical protein